MKHECDYCGHDFAKEPQPAHHCEPHRVVARTEARIMRWLRSYNDSPSRDQLADRIARGEHRTA